MCDCCGIGNIEESTVGIIESLGKFDYQAEPGCVCLNPCTQSIAARVSLRTRSFNVTCDSKSRDNVMISIQLTIMTEVIETQASVAWYKLSNPDGQIGSYAQNVVRGMLAEHTLDEVFLMRNEIEGRLQKDLEDQLKKFGYHLKAALVVDIIVAPDLRAAMELSVTNARTKQATVYRSEAEKLRTIKAAEAEAEAKRLSGVGLAEQRKAAIFGLQESVSNFEHSIPGMTPKDIMSLLLMNQYFDAVKEIVEISRGHTVFLPDTSNRAMEMTEGYMAAAGASASAMGSMAARRASPAGRR